MIIIAYCQLCATQRKRKSEIQDAKGRAESGQKARIYTVYFFCNYVSFI